MLERDGESDIRKAQSARSESRCNGSGEYVSVRER